MITKIPEQHCLECGNPFIGATAALGPPRMIGTQDRVVVACKACGALLMMDHHKIRPMDREEREGLDLTSPDKVAFASAIFKTLKPVHFYIPMETVH